jgi:hypothetical protein
MISIDEELEAAKAAQAAINTLSIPAPNPYIAATLRKAKLAAAPITNFSSDASLIKIRDKVVNALSDLIRALEEGQLTQRKIDKAKGAIEDWINRLKVLYAIAAGGLEKHNMFKLAMAVFAWCLVSITASAQSNKTNAVNELTGEMLECSVYYIISANCIEGHPDPDAPWPAPGSVDSILS